MALLQTGTLNSQSEFFPCVFCLGHPLAKVSPTNWTLHSVAHSRPRWKIQRFFMSDFSELVGLPEFQKYIENIKVQNKIKISKFVANLNLKVSVWSTHLLVFYFGCTCFNTNPLKKHTFSLPRSWTLSYTEPKFLWVKRHSNSKHHATNSIYFRSFDFVLAHEKWF